MLDGLLEDGDDPAEGAHRGGELDVGDRVLAEEIAGAAQLAEDELEPELVDLVDDDEEDVSSLETFDFVVVRSRPARRASSSTWMYSQ